MTGWIRFEMEELLLVSQIFATMKFINEIIHFTDGLLIFSQYALWFRNAKNL